MDTVIKIGMEDAGSFFGSFNYFNSWLQD